MDSAGGHLGSSREGGAGRGGVGLIFGLAGEPRPPTAQGRLGSSRRTAWHSAKRKEEEEMFVRNFVNGFRRSCYFHTARYAIILPNIHIWD